MEKEDAREIAHPTTSQNGVYTRLWLVIKAMISEYRWRAEKSNALLRGSRQPGYKQYGAESNGKLLEWVYFVSLFRILLGHVVLRDNSGGHLGSGV